MSLASIQQMSDYDLAHTLSELMGDAALSWDRFSENEKAYFRQLQDEACKRFIREVNA